MQNHEVINPKLDVEYNNYISGGMRLAESALPYMTTRGYSGIMETISNKDLPEEVKATTAMLLGLSEAVAEISNEKYDPMILSALNSSLGVLIDAAYGTTFTRSSIVNACIRFAKNNGLISNGDELKAFEDHLLARLMAKWSEHSWENLFISSGLSVEPANIEDDVAGTDLWVELTDGSGWVSVDIKAQPSTAHRHAAKKGREITEDHTIDIHEPGTHDFSLYVAANSEGKSAYLAFSNPPSDGLAPLDFRGKQKAIDAAKELATVLQYYADNGMIKRYDRREGQNSASFTLQKVRVK